MNFSKVTLLDFNTLNHNNQQNPIIRSKAAFEGIFQNSKEIRFQFASLTVILILVMFTNVSNKII